MKTVLKATALVAFALSSPAQLGAQPAAKSAAVPAGFTSLFDGKTLKGWRGDPKIWSVRDGAITSHSDTPISHNTFLILEKPYADFEIRMKYRFVTKTGNSGLQFRSGQVDGSYVMGGYQANITPANFENCGLPSCGQERFGMLYEELYRLEMVLLGERAEITRRQEKTGGTGQMVRNVLGTANPRDAVINTIKLAPEWNEVTLIVHGNRYVYAINGVIAFDATDKDPQAPMTGLIGIQAHAGPPTTAQFKDVVIKPLTSIPDIAGRFVSNPGPAPEPAKVYRTVKMETAAPATK